jgi:hypothetical protein
MTILKSPAAKLLQRRAIQCSFSSVFYLRSSGMPAPQARLCENVFLGAVGVPLALLGVTGLWYASRD